MTSTSSITATSTTSTFLFSTTSTSTSDFDTFKQKQYRNDILNSSLQQVHQYGWTDDAIAHGLINSNKNNNTQYPPSFIGMMEDNHSKSSDLIHFFMKQCNLKLKSHLETRRTMNDNKNNVNNNNNNNNNNISGSTVNHAEILKYCIQYRLEMVIPFVKSNRWSEGMALGAIPYNAMSTATHLEEIVTIIENELMIHSTEDSSKLTLLERTAIGAVYVATELHLLADTSFEYQDTWNFLRDRIQDLDMIKMNQSSLFTHTNTTPQFNQDTIVAGVAVASSLGSAVLSLMTPVARNGVNAMVGTIAPQVMNLVSSVSASANIYGSGINDDSNNGTKAKNYNIDDLPPFDVEDDRVKKK